MQLQNRYKMNTNYKIDTKRIQSQIRYKTNTNHKQTSVDESRRVAREAIVRIDTMMNSMLNYRPPPPTPSLP